MQNNESKQLYTNTSALISPLDESFFNRLQDRLHAITERTMEIGGIGTNFTIFINVIDKDQSHDDKKILFVGLETQERILSTRRSHKKYNEESFVLGNEFSELRKFKATLNDLKSGKFCIEKFYNGTLKVSDLEARTLENYFPKKEDNYTSLQVIEQPIFNKYLPNFENYYYLPIPLIAFAELVGVVQIVSEDNKNIKEIFNKRLLIKLFSIAFENLRLDWDIVGDNIKRPSVIPLEISIEKSTKKKYLLIEKSIKNPFLVDLDFPKYYKNAKRHLIEKRKNVNDIPLAIIEQYRRNGVMATLLDSYSHNMSAHSLTGLGWMFKQREKHLLEQKKGGYKMPDETLISSSLYLSREAYALIRHLSEKGAFWTRAMQPYSFGGNIDSFYSFLWKDFLQNPLFLGTIAHSEGIHRINLKIIVCENVESYGNSVKRKRYIKKNEKGELLCGILGYVDLEKVNEKAEKDDDISYFSFKGDEHERLAKFLKKAKVFFPGGVVGKHAFSTIIENEIRNVKHYHSEDARKHMQQNGLTICLSIESHTYRDKEEYKGNNIDKKNELWKVGIWINHLTKIDNNLAKKRLRTIGEDIIDIDGGEGSFEPHLGGSFQDKICAALLFNSTFTSVERKVYDRDKIYYPWIKAGCSDAFDCTEGVIDDWEFSYRRLMKEYNQSKKYFDTNFQTFEHGYLKKFIQLWKGEEVLTTRNNQMFYDIKNKWENPSRFVIINNYGPTEDDRSDIKESGVVRVIYHPNTNLTLEEAYLEWFKVWFKDMSKCFIFLSGQTNLSNGISAKITGSNGMIEYNGKTIVYRNSSNTKRVMNKIVISINSNKYNRYNLPFGHGGKDRDLKNNKNVCRYRSHGAFNYYFLKNKKLHLAELKPVKAAELLEVILTRICIYDNRIAERTKDLISRNVLKNKLFCSFYPENKESWSKEKNRRGFFQYHFLIVHLSFIEALSEEYSERNINDFIKNEILKNKNRDLNENFRLIITTGRGRMEWWLNLEPSYKKFVSFKPIDMLTSAVEQAISMDDDFELKYRLVKVLFGS